MDASFDLQRGIHFFLVLQKNVTYEPMCIFYLFKYRKNMVKYNRISMQYKENGRAVYVDNS